MAVSVYRGPLGRLPAPDDQHLRLYSMAPRNIPSGPESLVIGFDWCFDRVTEKKGPDGKPEYWAGLNPKRLPKPRGGHCVCIPYDPAIDVDANWKFYSQGNDGVCVSCGCSRRQTLANNGQLYDWLPLFDWAVKHDELSDTNTRADGTTVRAGLDYLKKFGGVRHGETAPRAEDGILEYIWCRSVNDMHLALKNTLYQQRGAAPFLNSWGEDGYPHLVWVPMESWDVVLFKQNGDCGLATDRPGGGAPIVA